MTGSSWAPIVIPIVAMITLAVWQAMVLHADSHPQHGGRSRASNRQITGGKSWDNGRQQIQEGKTPASRDRHVAPDQAAHDE
jgi:hypothetical protein